MSIPLMIGVSLVSADNWILERTLHRTANGNIAKLDYAKTLFTTPIAILGQAAGAASLPFLPRSSARASIVNLRPRSTAS